MNEDKISRASEIEGFENIYIPDDVIYYPESKEFELKSVIIIYFFLTPEVTRKYITAIFYEKFSNEEFNSFEHGGILHHGAFILKSTLMDSKDIIEDILKSKYTFKL